MALPLFQHNFLDPFFSAGSSASMNLEEIGRKAYFARKENQSTNPDDGDSKDLLSHLFRVRDDQGNSLEEGEIILSRSTSSLAAVIRRAAPLRLSSTLFRGYRNCGVACRRKSTVLILASRKTTGSRRSRWCRKFRCWLPLFAR